MSDISFTCAKCGQHLSIEAAAAGEEITCPTCGAPQRVPAPSARAFTYWAFISYSSRDRKWAEWLHRAIETFGVPAGIAGPADDSVGASSPRFHPVFRDRDELPASADLGARIRQALEVSNHLIVVCSPHAARSRWVNKEIDEFVALGRQDRVLSILVDGEPNTGDERECFPPALRGIEPIAADAPRG
ncbi:MAG: toll/interleukin-1 receptor domain-containing protein [Kiritimatiellia bacterium]